MEKSINQLEIPFKCFENCKYHIFPQKEARKRVWQCNYGWIGELDYYQWSVQGYWGNSGVFKKAKKIGMDFGFLLHTSSKQPVTIDDAERILSKNSELEKGTFISWASRFNRIFKDDKGQEILPSELWPFYYLEVPDGMGVSRPAYKMHPDRTSFVIVGVDPDSPYDPGQVDWSLLLEKPKKV